MKNTKKGYSPLLVSFIIFALAIICYSIYTNSTKFFMSESIPVNINEPVIQDDTDLKQLENDLNKIDTTELDKELNLLNSDTSTF